MFRETIGRTPFFGGVADRIFDRVSGEGIGGDSTFVSTLRALIFPRMQENDRLWFEYHTSRNRAPEDLGETPYVPDPNSLWLISFTRTGEEQEKWMKLLIDGYEKKFLGFHRLEKITAFYQKFFPVLCFVNRETRATILFVWGADMQTIHYLQCGILAYLPWYFDPTNGLSDTEKELIASLTERTKDKYISCLNKIVEKYDLRSENIKALLEGFESRFERVEISRAEEEINDILRRIQNYRDQIAEYNKRKRDLDIRILGLSVKAAENEGKSEIMEYFLRNKNVVLYEVGDDWISFGAKNYCLIYEQDAAKSAINNPNSFFYKIDGRTHEHVIPAEDMKLLMTEIFLNQKLRLRFCAAYKFSMSGNAYGLRNFTYSYEFSECTPNPHIDRFECIGDYQTLMEEALRENDFIMAVEQAIASCGSLNFNDYTVMKEFCRRIYGISESDVCMQCIELPDGSVVTPKDAIQYLKAQEA